MALHPVALGVGAIAALVAIGGIVWSERKNEVTTHLTIYVDPITARDGGMIIVSALPIPRAQWEKLPDTNTTAMWDTTNGKNQQVAAGDKHFGVAIASTAAAVEVFFPDDGTYTFNFMKYPTDTSSTTLTTERLEVGSGSALPDPATGKSMDWPSESLVAISGIKHGQTWVRTIDDRFFDLTGPRSFEYYKITNYTGGRLIELTDAALLEIGQGIANE